MDFEKGGERRCEHRPKPRFLKDTQKSFASKRLRSSGGMPFEKSFELPRQPFSFFRTPSHPESPQSLLQKHA